MKKQTHSLPARILSMLLALVCILGLLPGAALAASPDSIVMEDCTHNGVHYESAALDTCWLHQMKFDYNGDTVTGFCADHGGGMGWSLEGHEWNNPQPISDPTVKTMMAYYYAHSRGIFTDQAHALGVDEVWGSDYTWTMNAWVQAIIWRHEQKTLAADPVAACAEELMYVYNNLEHTSYTSIDDVVDGTSLRDRAQYILDLGAQGVWGDCEVFEYTYAGPGSTQHPAYDVQGIIIGNLTVTHEQYELTVKKVDATNPSKGLPGARFLVQNANGTYSKEVVTGADGTYTLSPLDANTYSITELEAPEGYQIDNPGPQYVVLPNENGKTVTVTFTDTPEITSEGSIRKVDADDPTKGLAGAVIRIDGVDNSFTGTYTTGAGGYLEDVPWDTMPIGSFVATEVTPPTGYTTSSDPNKVRQEFYWDGKSDVDLVFENDAKVKIELLKVDDSDSPIEGAVFNILKDGQIIGSEATDASGIITVTGITEGLYAFVEVSVPAPFARLTEPVVVHVDQADIDGGGTISVTAVDQVLPTLTILKRDGQTSEVVSGAVFEVRGIHHGYHTDVTTGPDGTATLTGLPVDSYEVTEISVPDPYVVAVEPTQTIWLGPGDDKQLIYDNLKQPQITIAKVDAADTTTPIPGTVFRIAAIDGDYQHDVTTGQDGTVTLRVQPGTYKTTEMSVPAPYYLPDKDADREQTITLNAGDEKEIVFKDHKAPELTVYKEDSIAGSPVEGARFHVTYTSTGEAADAPESYDFGEILTDANGEIKLHEQGQRLYTTDQNGEIRISGVTGTIVVKETKTIPGYTIDEDTRIQTVEVNPEDTQTLTVYNDPIGGVEIIKVNEADRTERIPNTTFEIRKVDDELIDTVTTGEDGRVFVSLEDGAYYAVETEAAEGFQVDPTPHYFEVEGGKTVSLTVTNKAFSGILIHKIDTVSREGICDVTFLLYDSNKNPIGQYTSDDRGYVYIDDLPRSGRYYLRELENEGYIVDEQLKTVYVTDGTTTEITWENTAITGQIQITKTSADYNSMNGWPAGTPIPNTEFEIYNVRTGNLVDTIKTDKNGVASSRPLPLGRYKIVESKAADFYGLDKTPIEVEIEYAGQIVKAAMTNKSLYTNVSIKKTGYVEVMPGQQIRYDFSGIGNNSTTSLTSFYWRDTLPTQAVRLDKLVTGTYNVPGNYKVVYKTNLNPNYRTMYDNLNTQQNYVLDASPAALGLASNEVITEFMVVFGVVPANFRQVETPQVYCNVVSWLTGGTQFVNQADTGGVYNGQWIMATSRWVTKVYKPAEPLPRTGY